MKRLFCLLLCLLCLSTAALAETSTEIIAEATVYDLGDLTIGVPAGAVVQQGEKVANSPFFTAYPNYDPNAAFADNYNIVWSQEDFSALFAQGSAEALAQQLFDTTVSTYALMGVPVTDAQVLAAAYDESGETFTYYSTMTVDFSGLGLGENAVITLHQVQMLVDMGEENGYVFTFSATDYDGMNALIAAANVQLA